MILDNVYSLINESSIERDIKHYNKLRNIPGKIRNDPKLAVKITKNITKDIIKNSPDIAIGFVTGLDPKGVIKTVKQKRNPLRHPIHTVYNITSGGWGKLIKISADSAIKSTKDYKK